MRRSLLVAASIAASLLAGPAGAASREPFETVQGWEVERTVGDTSANPCLMTHAYEDRDDNNAANAIVFALDGDNAVMVLVYQGWGFDKGETVKVPLFLDRKAVRIRSPWIGDDKTLRARFPDTLVPDLLAARKVILRFEDGDADFDIAHFAAGYEALRRCDAAPRAAPGRALDATVAAPALPPQARMATYAVGIALQRVLTECDVGSTATQRAAVDARMAALRPEMAAVEPALRSELQKKGFTCPPADKEPEFQAALRQFIELSPDAFAAAMERQVAAEKSAEAAPKP